MSTCEVRRWAQPPTPDPRRFLTVSRHLSTRRPGEKPVTAGNLFSDFGWERHRTARALALPTRQCASQEKATVADEILESTGAILALVSDVLAQRMR